MKYWGINLTKYVQDLYEENYKSPEIDPHKVWQRRTIAQRQSFQLMVLEQRWTHRQKKKRERESERESKHRPHALHIN